jgi:hyperosmotically inducible protein
MWRMSLVGAVAFAAAVMVGPSAAQAQYAAGGAPAQAYAPQPAVPDQSITADIHAKLQNIKLLRNAQVTIATKDGVVTLAGTVASDFARDQALDAARSTPGVMRIDDQLRLDISSPQAPTRN